MLNGKSWEDPKLLPIEEQKRTLCQQRCKFWTAIILSNVLAVLAVYTWMAPQETAAEVLQAHPGYQKISLPLEVFVPLDARPDIPITIFNERQQMLVALAYLWPHQHCPGPPAYYTVEVLPADVPKIVQQHGTTLQAYPHLTNTPLPSTAPAPRNHYEIKI